jgi:dihydroneopterin aldolase
MPQPSDMTFANEVPDLILVRGFVVPARIGIFAHERDAPQAVRINVTVEIAARTREPRGIDETLSYDLITGGIRDTIAAGHIELVESLAERIAAHVLGLDGALRVTVRAEKLEIIPGGSVGVEIVRARPGV